MERGRDAHGVRLRQLGALTGEKLVDGALPQVEPLVEMRAAERYLQVDLGVRPERAAAVGACAEQDGLPERRDPRHVCLEVELGHVHEDEADDRVGQGAAVERPHEPLAVGSGVDVLTVARGGHRRPG